MYEYDVALKLLLQGPANLIMTALAGGPVRRWLNVELPEIRNTRVDLLGETAGGGLVHIELQSGNDPAMALRMAEYCLRVYRSTGRLPKQILLYVGRERPRMMTELSGADLQFRYQLIDVRDLDGEALLASSSIGDNIVAILAVHHDQRDVIREVLRRIANLKTPGERELALKQLMLLSGLRKLVVCPTEHVTS